MDEYATVGALIDLYLKKYGEDEVVILCRSNRRAIKYNLGILKKKNSRTFILLLSVISLSLAVVCINLLPLTFRKEEVAILIDDLLHLVNFSCVKG